MNREQISNKIIGILRADLLIDEIKEDDNIKNDLMLDSLDIVELSFIIEKRFHITIDMDIWRTIEDWSVSQLIDYVDKEVNKNIAE